MATLPPSSLTTGKRDSIVDPMVQRSRLAQGAETHSADQGTLRRVLAGTAAATRRNGRRCLPFWKASSRTPRPRRSTGPCGGGFRGSAWPRSTTPTRRAGRSRTGHQAHRRRRLRPLRLPWRGPLPLPRRGHRRNSRPARRVRSRPAFEARPFARRAIARDGIEVTGYRLEVLGRAAR